MFPSVAFSVLFAILPIAFAQSSADPSSFTQGLTDYLNNLGYTGAADLISGAGDSDFGQQLLSQLSNNNNFTVFVPNNAALQNLPDSFSSDDELVSQYLLYHIVYGDFSNSTISPGSGGAGGAGGGVTSQSASVTSAGPATPSSPAGGSGVPTGLLSSVYPNVTLGRTLLRSSDLVLLPGNQSQVLAWTSYSASENVTILNQFNQSESQNITVLNSFTYQNLFLNIIDGVLTPPGNLTTTLNATNATAFLTFAQNITEQISSDTNVSALTILGETRGLTLFVPNDQAFQQAQQALQQYQNNQTALLSILGNYVINGTSLYSPDLWNATSSGSSNFTTAAGDSLSVSSNSSGLFIQNQSGRSAQIVRSDVLVENGVFHVVDNVLVDTNSNLAQASSAVASALSAATAGSSTNTLPIGGGFTTLTSVPALTTLSPSFTIPISTARMT